MESPVQDIIIGNIPDPLGTEIIKSSCNHDDNREFVCDIVQVNDEVAINWNMSNHVTDDHCDKTVLPVDQNVISDEQLTDLSATTQCSNTDQGDGR